MSIGVSQAHNDDVYVDYERLKDDNLAFLMFVAYYLFDIETRGWMFEQQYFKEEGKCEVDAIFIESKNKIREKNIGEYQTILSSVDSGEPVYHVPSKTYKMCRQHMVNFMSELESEGWGVDEPIDEIATKPDNSNIFCYPNMIIEYVESGNEEGVPPVPLDSWYIQKE